MNILNIIAHPDFSNPNRTANQLANAGLNKIAQLENAQITTFNLYDPDFHLPQISAETLNVRDPALMSDKQKHDYTQQRKLLAAWKAADWIFIYAPIHNFNVPARLKDFFDNVLIIGETFAFIPQGYQGLMSDKTKVTAVLTSGSDFSTDFRYQTLDIAPQFLRVTLHNMGINHMKLIRAQGLDIQGNDKSALIEQAKNELYQQIDHLNGL